MFRFLVFILCVSCFAIASDKASDASKEIKSVHSYGFVKKQSGDKYFVKKAIAQKNATLQKNSK